jgi:hypothetical protein
VPPVADWIPGLDFAPIVGILVRMPETVQQLGNAGIDDVGGGAEDYARAIKGENERVARAVQAAGIQPGVMPCIPRKSIPTRWLAY